MIPLDDAPLWHWIWENHPQRGTDGFRAIKNCLVDMAGSSYHGPGAHVLHIVREKMTEAKTTDAHYYRLGRYKLRAAEAIKAENWGAFRKAILDAHCEGAAILDEAGIV